MTCPYHHEGGEGDADGAVSPHGEATSDATGNDGTMVDDGEMIVVSEGAKLDFSRDMTYGDYLQLDPVLNAQHPLSPDHNELLFIIQHQTSELWMKLMLHELSGAVRCLSKDELGSAFKMLARVSKIMEQLVHAWDVLATMTPPEYSAIRPHLANSSGFQSWQYRCIEFMMGNKNAAMLRPHAHRPDILAKVEATFRTPSLYDESLRLLARRGIAVPQSHLERDWTKRYVASDEVEQAWLVVYRGRRAHRPGGRLPAVALPARDDGGARDRLQAGDGRDERGGVSAEDAGYRTLPRDLEAQDELVRADGRRGTGDGSAPLSRRGH